MVVKAGGSQGELLYSGTLEKGQGQRFVREEAVAPARRSGAPDA